MTVDTSVFTKPTASGDSINYNGICPEKYKVSTIKTLLHRAYDICCDWKLFHQEVVNTKQRLVNNNFTMKVLDKVLNDFITMKTSQQADKNSSNDKNNRIKLFYENQMWSNYKKMLRNI